MPTSHRFRELILRLTVTAIVSLGALAAASTEAHAAGSGMPWEAPLQRILESIEGPVAKVSAGGIIILTGLSLAFGDMGGIRRLVQIVFGLSIAFAATSFFLTFFSFRKRRSSSTEGPHPCSTTLISARLKCPCTGR
jgi:type IV secretion system protein VirB2